MEPIWRARRNIQNGHDDRSETEKDIPLGDQIQSYVAKKHNILSGYDSITAIELVAIDWPYRYSLYGRHIAKIWLYLYLAVSVDWLKIYNHTMILPAKIFGVYIEQKKHHLLYHYSHFIGNRATLSSKFMQSC